MEISSVENQKIKQIKKLRNNKFMMQEKKFIVEGEHLVREAFDAGLLEEVLKLSSNENNYLVNETIVSRNVLESISLLPSCPDVIGICKFSVEKETYGNKILMLDKVQDPGNLGTIIRSAKAFNFDTIILSPDSVKKYNDKVIRATQGMIFKTNVLTKDLSEVISYLKENGYDVYGTNVNNGISINEVEQKNKIAIVMGSEGRGVSSNIEKLLDKNIYIKMNDECESLNVAVAASIIMYELGV